MDGCAIPGGEHGDGRSRSEDVDFEIRRSLPPLSVPQRRPCEQRPVPDEPCAVVDRDVRAVRKIGEIGSIGPLGTTAGDPIIAQAAIDDISACPLAVAVDPNVTETPIVFAAAFRAWAVTGGESRRLIEEEQFGPGVRPHDGATDPLVFELAGDPAAHLRVPDYAACIVVKDAAIAHHEAAPRQGDDLTERSDAVLERSGGH